MDSERFRDRRGLLMERLSKGLIVVRGAGNGRSNAGFRWLTGFDEPRGALLLAPAGTRIDTGREHPGPNYVRGRLVQQLLFLPSADPLARAWGEEGEAIFEGADARALGVDAVLPASKFEARLAAALSASTRLYFVRAAPPVPGQAPDDEAEFVARLRDRHLDVEIHAGAPMLDDLRRIKDAFEIAAIERAVRLTGEALDAAVAAARSGVAEHAVEAEIARVYRRHGATHAFEPIVGCGDNALRLHYTENSTILEPGKLLLIDSGAALNGYRADLTRTVPVDGRFDPRQREVYEAVLRAADAAIEMCRPGATLGDIHARAWETLDAAGLGAAFPHGIGHHLGLETHDVGDVRKPLEAGCVLTIEPGAYLAAEGIGVRIEDDVLVTPHGPRVLSAAVPRTADDVERWVLGSRA